MKTRETDIIYLIVTLACQLCTQVCAQSSTNTSTEVKKYPIKEVFEGWNSQDAQYYQTRRSDTVTIPETLPASQAPDGNWGELVDGLQLSLRFRHREYLLKEPVMAVVILRNLGASSREIILCQDEYEYAYILHQGTNTVITKYPLIRPRLDTPIPYKMESNAETLQIIDLNGHCDLKEPGKYSIEIQRLIRAFDGHGMTNINSGTATFEIVKEYSPAEIAARNLQTEEWRKIQGTNQ